MARDALFRSASPLSTSASNTSKRSASRALAPEASEAAPPPRPPVLSADAASPCEYESSQADSAARACRAWSTSSC
jgi:hypothetical protein